MVKNVTISLKESLARWARVKAAEQAKADRRGDEDECECEGEAEEEGTERALQTNPRVLTM